MNRIKAIFFLISFLIANSGIALSMHWCGGKLTHISFFSSDHACACGKKEAEMKSGCCKDKLATLKSKDDQSISNILVFKAPASKLIAIFHPHSEIVDILLLFYSSADFYRPPPGKPKEPLYILNEAFLI